MTKKRNMLLVLCLVFVTALVSVGGTIAWIKTSTQSVVNEFTVGDIEITLTETQRTYKMVPGNELPKDPKVTVSGGSEACWLFVKVEEKNNLVDYIDYSVDASWTELDGVTGVYYREVAASNADQEFAVLTGNKVKVWDTVTKDMLETAESSIPQLVFTAYAVQKDNVADAATAWTIATATN